MSDMVTIKCIEGSLKGQTWTFHCVDTAIIGRTAKEDRTIVNKINVTGNDRISRFNTFSKLTLHMSLSEIWEALTEPM